MPSVGSFTIASKHSPRKLLQFKILSGKHPVTQQRRQRCYNLAKAHELSSRRLAKPANSFRPAVLNIQTLILSSNQKKPRSNQVKRLKAVAYGPHQFLLFTIFGRMKISNLFNEALSALGFGHFLDSFFNNFLSNFETCPCTTVDRFGVSAFHEI